MTKGDTIRVRGRAGIAFWIKDIDDDAVKAVMVGDDREHTVDVEDCTPLDEDEFCGECGQIGCGHGNS